MLTCLLVAVCVYQFTCNRPESEHLLVDVSLESMQIAMHFLCHKSVTKIILMAA